VSVPDPDRYRITRPLIREDVMTADEVADLLHVAPSTVRVWARGGSIPSRRFGRLRRFIRPEIEAWVADGGTAGSGS
jgi:excisionase family DNA binding protein